MLIIPIYAKVSNKHFVVLFKLDKTTNTILFYRYAHHDEAYK
ncbi:hypothetical protein SPONN_547 [uncultured Candidatus Thioglobus sp.]|nr:hypothetical protein SPONN_547 [uncultured Candidatus Thioglobus sp.]